MDSLSLGVPGDIGFCNAEPHAIIAHASGAVRYYNKSLESKKINGPSVPLDIQKICKKNEKKNGKRNNEQHLTVTNYIVLYSGIKTSW